MTVCGPPKFMGNPKQPKTPKSRKNEHTQRSLTPGQLLCWWWWWCYLRKLLMAVHPHRGTPAPPPCPALPWLYSPPDAPPNTKWPPTSISTADGSCWNLCAIWVSATPPLLPCHLPPPTPPTVGHSFAYLAWNKKAFKRHFVSFASSSSSGKNWNDKCFGFCDFVYCSNFAQKKKKIVQILPHV